ncbi:hypothetical protein ScPMuIL_017134 [Solemya velum]
MKLYLALVFFSCAGHMLVESALHKLSWSTCGSNSPIIVHSLDVSPMPITLPGHLTLTLNSTLTRQITNSTLRLKVKRHTFLMDFTIPCLLNMGSCTYDSVCTMADSMIAHNWAGNMAGVGTQIKTMLTETGVAAPNCVIGPRNVVINRYQLTLPGVSSLLSLVSTGDYSIGVHVTEHSTGQEIFCANLEISLAKCHSGSC